MLPSVLPLAVLSSVLPLVVVPPTELPPPEAPTISPPVDSILPATNRLASVPMSMDPTLIVPFNTVAAGVPLLDMSLIFFVKLKAILSFHLFDDRVFNINCARASSFVRGAACRKMTPSGFCERCKNVIRSDSLVGNVISTQSAGPLLPVEINEIRPPPPPLFHHNHPCHHWH